MNSRTCVYPDARHYVCLSGEDEQRWDNVRCTTGLDIVLAELTVMRTLVTCPAAVVALVEQTAKAEEMTRHALSAAELDICLHLDNDGVKFSAQVVDGGRSILEPLQVQIQPKPDMIDSEVS
jgi:hypothetical protein